MTKHRRLRLGAALALAALASGGGCGGLAVLSPNPPGCPESAPAQGAACAEEGLDCTYASGCAGASFRCEGGAWLLVTVSSCPPCAGLGAAACAERTDCRYLHPGCDDFPVSEGCYDAEDCTEGSCGSGEVCSTRSYDPCFGSNCQACGADASVCLAE